MRDKFAGGSTAGSTVAIRALGLSAILSCLPALAGPAALHGECPGHASSEVIHNTSQWADKCFMAYTGRLPGHTPVESQTLYRDIDLDGKDEILELRGHGTASVPIFVFKTKPDQTFRYIGKLHASPDFKVQRNPGTGLVTIEYIHQYGINNSRRVTIRYIDKEFRVIATQPVSGHN